MLKVGNYIINDAAIAYVDLGWSELDTDINDVVKGVKIVFLNSGNTNEQSIFLTGEDADKFRSRYGN